MIHTTYSGEAEYIGTHITHVIYVENYIPR
jgi:hypothetical protein